MSHRSHRSHLSSSFQSSLQSSLFVALALAAIVDCTPKKKTSGDAPTDDDTASTKASPAPKSSSKKKTIVVGDTDSTADPKTVGPSADKDVSGCALPADGRIKAEWKLEKGCALDVKSPIVIVDGGVLTIAEGVKLSFTSGAYVDVRAGKIVARGSDEAPIVFTAKGSSPSKGDWAGVIFQDGAAAGNVLDHVTIEYAGKTSYVGRGVLRVRGSAPKLTLTHSKIRHSIGEVVIVDEPAALFTKLEGNTFEDNDGVAMRVPANVMGSVGDGNVFGGPIHLFRDVTTSATWPKIDSFFVVEGRMRLLSNEESVTLTLPEGATLKMNGDAQIEIGGGGGSGLIAKNVTFTSAAKAPAAGDWSGLIFYGKTGTTKLDGCTFEYAGQKSLAGVGVLDFHDGKPSSYPGFSMTHTTFKSVTGPAVRADKGDCGDLFSPAKGNTAGGVKACAKDAG